MSDITDRLDALEAESKANQLPPTFAILQRRLEQNWQPDASVLLQSGSITGALMTGVVDADGKGFTLGNVHKRWGTATATLTASTVSATVTVAHGLGKVPASAQVTLVATAGFGAAQGVNLVAVPDITNIQFQVDASVATSGTFTVYWEVVG